MGTGFMSLESNTNSRGENVYESRGNKEGIRESMVRRIRNKGKKSQNHTTTNQGWADNWANGSKKNHNMGNNHGMNNNNSKGTMDVYEKAFDTIQPKDQFDRFMENPNLLLGNAKNEMYYDPESRNVDHDYLVVQPTIRGRNNTRPTYAEFTPRSGYSPRDLFVSEQHQHYTKDSTPSSKDSSPTSVMDAYATSNSAGVRWNQELTQQEFILTPQSTKLRPDSDEVQFRNYSGKPKSILRSRYSSSYGSKVQMEDRPLEYQSQCPSDEYPVVPERGFSPGKVMTRIFDGHGLDPVEVAGMNADFSTMMGGFVDENGSEVSPIGKGRQGDAANGKFPESYVQFIEAVASVVIQTKMRQKLAKNKVRKMRNERYAHHQLYQSSANHKQYQSSESEPNQSSETKMTHMVRKSYELAKTVRQGNDMRKPRGRQDVALDFYALAAIQIQAAYRGWWVRDCLAVDNFCAILIQKTFRGSRCRNEVGTDLYRVVKVQSVCRRWIAMDTAVTRIYCVVRIQAIMRGALVRNRMMYDFLENYHAAATTIQTFWRRFMCEMTFWQAYEDILVVQSIARGWIARRRFQSRLKAKTSKFSQRFKSDTRRNSSKLPSKSRNSGSTLTTSNFNHAEFMKRTLSPGTFSRPSRANKVDKPYSESREINSQLKSHNEKTNSNKGIRTMKKFNPKPALNSLKNSDDDSDGNFYDKLRKQTVKSHGGKAVSASRADIDRRRNSKEQEAKAKREGDNRRLEIQAAEMADLENRRKKMASKAAAREKERLAAEQIIKSPESMNFTRTEDVGSKTGKSSQRTFAKNGKAPNKSDPITTDDKEGRIPVVASGKGTSLVAKRMQELKISNRNDASSTKHIVPPVKNHEISEENTDIRRSEPKNQVLKRTNISSSANQKDMQNQVLKRINISSSAYQKDMQNLRSESEQRRIDGMHYIFQQAGLLFSPTKDSIPAAKTHEIREEDTFINKSEGKVHSKKEVLPRGSTQTGIIDTHEIKRTDKRDSHPDQIVSRSEPNNQVFKRTNPDPIASRSEPKNQVLKQTSTSISKPKSQVLKRTNTSSSEPKNQVLKRTNTRISEPKSQVVKRTNTSSSEPKNQVLKRTITSSSAYQKDMQNLRSESEQRRIDGMHHIFQQAGLLSQKSSISAAKTHEIPEEETYINKFEGKVQSKREVFPTGSTQIGKVHSKKEVLSTVSTQNRKVRSNKEILPTASTQIGKVHSKREALPTGTQIGFVDTREIKKTDERDSHPNLIASRSEPKNHVVKRTHTSSSAYQKDMQNLRSESEQRRIDDMHNIFEQAGLLCRVK